MPIKGVSNVKKAMQALEATQNKRVKAEYINGLNAIIKATPVHFKDGGRLKNNWFLSVGSASSKTTSLASGKGLSSYAQVNQMPEWVLGKKIYFTNNLPYARVVEYGGYPKTVKYGTNVSTTAGKTQYQQLSSGGYSRQAPQGMVRINLVKIRNRIRAL